MSEVKDSLWQINAEYLELEDTLIESGGELTDEVIEKLDINEDNFEEKIQSYVHVIKRMQTEAEAAKKEENRWKEFRRKREKSVDRMMDAIDQAMKLRGLDEFETPEKDRFRYRKSTSVGIVNEDVVERKYKTPQKPKIDKREIGKDLRDGKTVRGAELQEKYTLKLK